MRISIPVPTGDTDLLTQVRQILRSLEAQLNNAPDTISNDGVIPKGTRRNDLIFSLRKGILKVGVFDGKRARYINANDLQVLQSNGLNFVGRKTGTTAASNATTRTTYFPNDGDWGFYFRSPGAPPNFYLFFNHANTNMFVAMN